MLRLIAVALALCLTWGAVSTAFALTEEETKRTEALIPMLDGKTDSTGFNVTGVACCNFAVSAETFTSGRAAAPTAGTISPKR